MAAKVNLKGALDFRDRRRVFADLEQSRFDLLVIGAGITGSGIAREAAMRGLSAVLVDAGDIGSGTSSRSSKLIHGGLRYMAQKEFGVVREAARERTTLRRLAPHLALTNPMVLLCGSKTIQKAMQAVMWTFEKLAGVDKAERHELWDLSRLEAKEPSVKTDEHRTAVVYPEYVTDDMRLTLANVRSAKLHGATVATYAKAVRLIVENGRIEGAEIRSTLPHSEEGARVKARIVVNAAGPWVDVVRALEDPQAKAIIQLTKGIHVVVPKNRLPITRTVVMTAQDKRGLFAVPRGEVTYIGTTDTFYPKPEYDVKITLEDVNYLLENAGVVFRGEPLSREDVVAMWSGVRPLLSGGSKNPSEISRRNEIIESPHGLLSMAGGKLTAYRSMAERLVDKCEERFGRKPHPGGTADEALPGGDLGGPFQTLVARVEKLGIKGRDATRIAQLYGSEALDLGYESKGIAAEVGRAVRVEGALTLADYWDRRSARSNFDPDGGLAALEPAADQMAKLLGWPDAEKVRQIEECRHRREAEMQALALT